MQTITNSFTLVSANFAVLAIIFGFFIAFSIYFGKSKLVSIIFSFYPALLIFENFPFFKQIDSLSDSLLGIFLIKLAVFLVPVIFIYFILNKAILIEWSYSKIWGFAQSVLLSLIALSLSLILVCKIIPIEGIYSFSQPVVSLFNSQSLLFWWLLVPLVAIFVMLRR